MGFWEAIEKLVHFKHKAVLEAKLQKAHIHSLMLHASSS